MSWNIILSSWVGPLLVCAHIHLVCITGTTFPGLPHPPTSWWVWPAGDTGRRCGAEGGVRLGLFCSSLSATGRVPGSSCVSSMSPDPAGQPLPTWSYLSCSVSTVALDPNRRLGFWALVTPSSLCPSSPEHGRSFLLMLLSPLSPSCPI